MEEIVSAVLRFAAYVFIEGLFFNVFYYIGWTFLKVITLGKKPEKPKYESDSQDIFCGLLGFLIVVLVGLYFFGFF